VIVLQVAGVAKHSDKLQIRKMIWTGNKTAKISQIFLQ